MKPIKPQRIQRLRTKHFNLERASLNLNGLKCTYVGRPGIWGNPFMITALVNAEEAVEMFRAGLRRWDNDDLEHHEKFALMHESLHLLKGKNLACWCNNSQICHADVLLEFANYN